MSSLQDGYGVVELEVAANTACIVYHAIIVVTHVVCCLVEDERRLAYVDAIKLAVSSVNAG